MALSLQILLGHAQGPESDAYRVCARHEKCKDKADGQRGSLCEILTSRMREAVQLSP